MTHNTYSLTTSDQEMLADPKKKTSQECETALTSHFDSLEKKVEQVEKSWKPVDFFLKIYGRNIETNWKTRWKKFEEKVGQKN